MKDKIFIFKYKVVEITLAKEAGEPDKVEDSEPDWEKLGITPKNRSTKKSAPAEGTFNGRKVERTRTFWRLKTFSRFDIISIEECDKNTMLVTTYGPYIIEPSFIDAFQQIYNTK